jgi:hypothetical protein
MPMLTDVMNKSMDAVTRLALLSSDLTSTDRTQVEATRNALAVLAEKIDLSYRNTTLFQKVVTELPRLTTVLNQAKRETANVLEEMRTAIAAGRQEILETIKILDNLLDGAP